MYDELVTRLREYVPTALANCDFDFVEGWSKEAADAIEELSKRVDESIPKDDAEIIIAEVAKPRWIPVTERLPEKKKAHYLCLLDDDSMAVVYWSKVPDWASKGEWTWHNPNWKEVTHWMPLPEPPKEE